MKKKIKATVQSVSQSVGLSARKFPDSLFYALSGRSNFRVKPECAYTPTEGVKGGETDLERQSILVNDESLKIKVGIEADASLRGTTCSHGRSPYRHICTSGRMYASAQCTSNTKGGCNATLLRYARGEEGDL